MKNPGLLLCDEPTGALDYQTSKEILELMETVNRDFGCTIVIVTHNDAIKHMAHRVLRLRDGQLVENVVNAERMRARPDVVGGRHGIAFAQALSARNAE